MKNTDLKNKTVTVVGLGNSGLNASLLEVCIFLTCVPLMKAQLSSELPECMHIPTSAISDFAAICVEHIKLKNASLEPLSLLRCAPVTTTGEFRLLSMKLSAADA